METESSSPVDEPPVGRVLDEQIVKSESVKTPNVLTTILEDAAAKPSESSSLMSPAAGPSRSSQTLAERRGLLSIRPESSATLHLVPNIVVEHVSSSYLVAAQLGHSLTPPAFSSRWITPPARATIGRQERALSDSSVLELQKLLPGYSSGSADGCIERLSKSCAAPSLADNPPSTSGHRNDASPCGSIARTVACLNLTNSPVLDRSESAAVNPSASVPHFDSSSSISNASSRFSGPEKSPKAYWLRRHSDSNLASGQGSGGGLRVEPYPVRCYSTGDSGAGSTVSMLSPLSSLVIHEFCDTLEDQSFASSTSVKGCQMSRFDLLKPAGGLDTNTYQPAVGDSSPSVGVNNDEPMNAEQGISGRYSTNAASRMSREGQRITVAAADNWNETRTSENVKEELRTRHGNAVCRSTETTAIKTKDKIDVQANAGVAENVVLTDRRLKLKKYLQTKYQMSLSSDTDDVFMDRFASPGPNTPPVRRQTELTAHNLTPHSVNRQTSDNTTEWRRHHLEMYNSGFQTVSGETDDSAQRRRTIDRGESSEINYWSPFIENSSSSSSMRRRGDPAVKSHSEHHPVIDPVKTEPPSPRVIPMGASVFVFPPPLVPVDHWSPHTGSLQYVHRGSQDSCVQTTTGLPEQRTWSPKCFGRSSDETRTAIQFHSRDYQQQQQACSEADSKRAFYRLKSDSSLLRTDHMMDLESTSDAVLRPTLSDSYAHHVTSRSRFPEFRYDSPVPFGKVFQKKYSSLHPDEHHGWKMNSPGMCQVASSSSSAAATTVETQSFVCPVCSVAFMSYKCLADHMTVHVSVPPTPSVESAKDAASTESVAGSKPVHVHLCPVCQRTFSRGDMLTRHVRLHTGVRPYVCTLCSQVFSRSDHLTTHQRTHTGEKPYRCPVCSYAAPRRDMVTRHARIHENSSGASASSGRRGRRAASVSGPEFGAASAAATRFDPLRVESARSTTAVRRHMSDSGFWASHLGGGGDDDLRRGSVTSSVSSIDSSVSVQPPPVTCRAWSTTSADSFESYPGACHRGSSVSSVTADSPDVFSLPQRQFRWGSEVPSSTEAKTRLDDVTSSSLDVMSGVTPVFQKFSVKSPTVRDRDSENED